MTTRRMTEFERLFYDCRKAGLTVTLSSDSPDANQPVDRQPLLRIVVVRKHDAEDWDVLDETPWVEAGGQLHRAAVSALTRLAGAGLI